MEKTVAWESNAYVVHDWLRPIEATYVPGVDDEVLAGVAEGLLEQLRALGHRVTPQPTDHTDLLLTSAPFDRALSWREALMFTARRRFGLRRAPTVVTLLRVSRAAFESQLKDLEAALTADPPDAARLSFPGLAPNAWKVLLEQGQRGGPLLALLRLVQARTKCIRNLLVVGEDRPQEAYLFDLVGAHPRIAADDADAFHRNLTLRLVTATCTREITNHAVVGEPVPLALWQSLETPGAMIAAAREFDRRNFFTAMLRISDLVQVPALEAAVSSQYSEGCFATWEPRVPALIATITGSARPVDKGDISEADLALIVGVQPDGSGALVRHVEGKPNDPPSSEAVELMEIDMALPRVRPAAVWGIAGDVPVVRSKLHGHRGVRSYDPHVAEHVALDAAFYDFPVSCSTDAQARAITAAFQRSEALRTPDDPRRIVFTVLPGHGVVLAEKWVPGKRPFQALWEAMDSGGVEISRTVPQGRLQYRPGRDGRMILEEG